MSSVRIRLLSADDWALWRDVRLRSLADAPEAFGSTLADWQGDNDREERWRERFDNVRFNAVAIADGEVVGTVGGMQREGARDSVELISMWVAPEARGAGAGDALISAVVEWAVSESVVELVLAVRRGNRPARVLYERAGFVLVGPHPDDSDEDLMIRVLAGGTVGPNCDPPTAGLKWVSHGMTSRSAFRPVGAATPLVEATVGIAAAALFSTTSALRRARTFHPIGAAFEATFTVVESAGVGVELLDTPGTHAAVVRLSRGVGVREPWPDVLGLAVRVLDAHGPGAHQDQLLVTSGERPIVRHLFVPTTSFDDVRFSSVLPYRLGGRIVLFGARSDDLDSRRLLLNDIARDGTTSPVRFTIDIATPRGSWEPVARIDLGRQLSDRTADALRFNPANTGGGIEPVGVLQATRRLAYAASQAGRSSTQR